MTTKKRKVITKGNIVAKGKKLYKQKIKPAAIKFGKGSAASYAKYGKPSVTLGKRLLKWGVVKPAKLALRFPGVGLAATGLYYAGKHIAKRQKGLQFSQYRQYNKKGRKIL